jgi:hypothetical protein
MTYLEEVEDRMHRMSIKCANLQCEVDSLKSRFQKVVETVTEGQVTDPSLRVDPILAIVEDIQEKKSAKVTKLEKKLKTAMGLCDALLIGK